MKMKTISRIERQRLIAALAKRGMNFTDLCRELRISKATLPKVFDLGKLYPTRRRIDLFLGEAILTPDFEFSYHNAVSSLIGVDPVITPMNELRKLAEGLGIKSERLNRTQIVTSLVGIFSLQQREDEVRQK